MVVMLASCLLLLQLLTQIAVLLRRMLLLVRLRLLRDAAAANYCCSAEQLDVIQIVQFGHLRVVAVREYRGHEIVQQTSSLVQNLAEEVLQVADPQATVRSRRSTHVDQLPIRQGMLVEAFVAKRTLARALLEMLAVGRIAGLLVIVDQLVLFLTALHPNNARANEIRRDATRRAATFDFILEVLRLSPRPDALQAEYVIAIWQNTESLLAARLLQNHLQTDAANFIL